MVPEQPSKPAVTDSTEAKARFYVPALDGMRTVAFLMVWWVHALPVAEPFQVPPVSLRTGFVQSGAYGVPVFFVLSAFLITRLLLAEKDLTGTVDLKAYYVRRTLRIWPLYFLVVGISFLLSRHRETLPSAAYWSHLTFTANWYRAFGGQIGYFGTFADVLWSVSVEEQFYIVWPFVLTRLSPRNLRPLCYAMIVVAFASRLAFVNVQHDWGGMWFSSLSHLDSLALGTLLALKSPSSPRPSTIGWYAALAACPIVLILQASVAPIAFRSTPYDLSSAALYTVVPFVAAAMIALALTSNGTFLENRAMVMVGRLTFGMYCFHRWVLHVVHGRDPFSLVVTLVLTFGMAWISYHLYEARFLKLKRRFERIQTRPAT